jgi:hypothetical protein
MPSTSATSRRRLPSSRRVATVVQALVVVGACTLCACAEEATVTLKVSLAEGAPVEGLGSRRMGVVFRANDDEGTVLQAVGPLNLNNEIAVAYVPIEPGLQFTVDAFICTQDDCSDEVNLGLRDCTPQGEFLTHADPDAVLEIPVVLRAAVDANRACPTFDPSETATGMPSLASAGG